MPKYKHGKQTKPIDFEEFKEKIEAANLTYNHKSFLAFLYWSGFRKSEALERVKEDFTVEDRVLIVKLPAKLGIRASSQVRINRSYPFVDLIVDEIKKASDGQRVWDFSGTTAWRIVKTALGEKYYPHCLRLGIESRESIAGAHARVAKIKQATSIVESLVTTNLLFEAKKQARLFRKDSLKLVPEFYTPCRSGTDFVTKIARLANLFEVPLASLRNLVHEPEDRKSIGLVEKWLQDEGLDYDADMIEIWKKIVILRNVEPLHANTNAKNYLQALDFFGLKFPIDYAKLWDVILEKFATSLEAWQRILENL